MQPNDLRLFPTKLDQLTIYSLPNKCVNGPGKSLRPGKDVNNRYTQKHKALLYHVMTKPNNTTGRTRPPLDKSSSGVAKKKKKKKIHVKS